jgi:hypothetical protein
VSRVVVVVAFRLILPLEIIIQIYYILDLFVVVVIRIFILADIVWYNNTKKTQLIGKEKNKETS